MGGCTLPRTERAALSEKPAPHCWLLAPPPRQAGLLDYAEDLPGDRADVLRLVDQPCIPYNYPTGDPDHKWPYCVYDGRYEDRATHLAVRYKDRTLLRLLLGFRPDPTAVNDEGKTALQLARGEGEAWDHAFGTAPDRGATRDELVSLFVSGTVVGGKGVVG